jgi:dethiobiotin synthetase
MKQGYFITGTDTDVGKTWATTALMRHCRQQGLSVIGMKPVAAGCNEVAGELKNDDALQLQAEASVAIDYQLMNPYAYALPVSPHIAGRDNPVQLPKVLACFQQLQPQAEIILVEGAGGWYAPINNQQSISDLAIALNLPVILVVGIKLGCINHSLLSYQAINQSGLVCAGWIANCIQPEMLCMQDNIDTLKALIPAPLLGVLPYLQQADFDLLAAQLRLP